MDEILNDLKKRVETLEKTWLENVGRISIIDTKLDYMTKIIDKLDNAINVLTGKPSKLMDNVVTAVITAIVVSIATAVLSQVIIGK